MDSETFRTRLLKLLQKSRQAYRLYQSLGQGSRSEGGEFTEVQAREWQLVNAELVKELSLYLDRPNQKELVAHAFSLRDRMQSEFRSAETEVCCQQKDLVFAAEKGDFIKAAILSRQLVINKARAQALQAAHHEMEEAITHSKISRQATIPLEAEQAIEPAPLVKEASTPPQPEKLAQVIPLRRKQVSI